MGGRAWSQEELIRLEELTETYPLATVARKLNRSENAVFLKRQRTGMLETNVKTGDPAEENASSLHRVRTQNRK